MSTPTPSQKFLRTTTGPLQLEFQMYSSIEDYDRDAGYSGAALEYACRWHCHRDTIDVFNEAFTPFVEKLTGILREIDEKVTAKCRAIAANPSKVTPVRERFTTYINRVFAKTTKEQQNDILAEAVRLSRTILVSAAPAKRKLAIEPMYYKRADSILLADLDTINEKVSRHLSLVPDHVLDRDLNDKPVRESLARLLQRFDAARWALEE